ncbi:MFS transporter [Micrococcus terreus]|uniref:Putative proline/betaine transporter n=1 Tax=Micrococcus terreus TaxID=574650 RepID=A0A1I7MT18_9MICC|nr:MFS transporter [Micrococcus terreus]SFV25064.1 Na+/melibiose symporter [Micrococcus terreus]
METTPITAPAETTRQKTPRKAALASLLGSSLEYYDFFIYGSAAALVFNVLFFPSLDPTVGLVAAFGTFGVGYAARPIGAMVMGHFGDKIGRKRALLFTVVLMGVVSLAIGFLPTYDAIGLWAPVLLTLCRLLQGFSAGAESAGASVLTLEHSPEGRRGFFSSSVMVGYAVGMVLATVVFLPIAVLPEEALYSWGWRVPFWASIVVAIVAVFVRNTLSETPSFEAAKEKQEVKKVPLVEVLRHQPMDVVRVALATTIAMFQSLFTVFILSYSTTTLGLDRATMLTINAVTIGLSIITLPLAAKLSDRFGRRPLMFISAAGCALTLPLYFMALSTQNIAVIFVVALVHMTLFFSAYNGVWPAFYAEQFASPVRYSGMAVGNQVGNLLAGFAPMIAALLVGSGTFGWVPVTIGVAGVMVVASVAIYFMRETAFTRIEDLDRVHDDSVNRRNARREAALADA